MPCQSDHEKCASRFFIIPIDQFHQSEQFLTLFKNLTTTDASSINWLHSKYSQRIDLRFLKLNIVKKSSLYVLFKIELPMRYTRCLKIREFRIQSVVGDHLSSLNMEKKSRLLPQRYIGMKVHFLNCVFFKYRLKSSVFIVIYGVDDCGK
jgi:hypothetical protein